MWEPSAVGTFTELPVCQPPPSTEYLVVEIPEPASFALSDTVTGAFCQPDGALSVVVGAVLSTTIPLTAPEVVTLPATSVTTTWSE